MKPLIAFALMNLSVCHVHSQTITPREAPLCDTIFYGSLYWDLNCRLNSASQPIIDSIALLINERNYDSCLISTTVYMRKKESQSCAHFKSGEVKNALVLANVDWNKISVKGKTIIADTKQATWTLILGCVARKRE